MGASTDHKVDLDSVIITAELQRRPSRLPDHESENRALIALAQEMARSPRGILDRLAQAALDLCRAQSAGISLLQRDEKRFHWPALVGEWARHLGGSTPREYGPCGTVLDRDTPLLFSHPERFFDYLVPVTPGIEEALLVPFYVNGKAVGTIWVIAHDKGRRFDTEDLRLLSSLSQFASATYQVLSSIDALHASEERHRAVETVAGSIIWTTDADGAFIEAQRSWEEYTGQPWSEHKGVGWAEMLHPDDREAILAAWRAACREGRIYESRGRVWHAGSEGYRHFAFRAAPVRDVAGQVREWVGTVTDVEERWQAEQGLRQMDRMETVGQLAGGIAHEANNQMTVVLGFSDYVLRRADLPETIRRDIQQVRKAAERTAAITSQLLAFSRRQVLHPSALDLNGLIRGMEPIMRRTLGEAGTLVLELLPTPVVTRVDAGQFEQVLLNFVLNARDAMPEGGRLTVGTRAVELTGAPPLARPRVRMEPGRYCELTVADSGVGMDADTMSRIFEPFFTTKPVGRGNGLGLSTVYGIVKQSGGYIWTASQPGRGTTFTVHLPMVSEAVSTVAKPREMPAPASGGQTILVVEDEPSVREITTRVLTDRGYLVLDAENGQVALDLLTDRGDHVDAVVTDVAMPGLSGRELAARIGQLRPGVPVLFMSGHTDDDMIRRGLLEAGQPFLRKPFSPEELVQRVSDLLGDRVTTH